jgi:hypothetical protein
MESLPPEMHTAIRSPGGDEFVLLDGGDERRPEHLVEFFLDAALDQLIGFELSAHVDRSRL